MEHSLEETLRYIRKSWEDRRLQKRTIDSREKTLAVLEERALAAASTTINEKLISEAAVWVKESYKESSWHVYLLPLREICSYCAIECDELPGKPVFARMKTSVPERFAEVHEAYLERAGLRGLAVETLRTKERTAREFLHFVDDRIGSLEELSSEDVEAFLLSKKESCCGKSMTAVRSHLKIFLQDLASRCIIPAQATLTLIDAAKTPPSTLQTFLTEDEVIRMLEAAAGYGRYPKRALAVTAILIQYGVRAKDVRDLTLGDIDWTRNTITFAYTKTSSPKVRPLTEVVRYLILDYLKNERPETDHPNVFLRMKYPVGPYTSSGPLTDIIHGVAKEAGIKVKGRFGCHTIRRTSATMLLQHDSSYENISNFLNQVPSGTAMTSGTTMKYLKVDIERLRKVALEVPRAS